MNVQNKPPTAPHHNTQYMQQVYQQVGNPASKPSERSKSPATSPHAPWDDRRVSPIKYHQYPSNGQPHPQVQPQQKVQHQPQGNTNPQSRTNQKQNVKVGCNQHKLGTVQAPNGDKRINAIERVIQNCSVLNYQPFNSPNKPAPSQGCLPTQSQISQHDKRASTPTQCQPHQPPPQMLPQPAPQAVHPVHPHQQNAQLGDVMCVNKDSKKAKYARSDSLQQAYCSKCSIALVSLGIKMVDIEAPKAGRQKQLKGFMADVNNLKNNIAKTLNSMQGEKSRIAVHTKDQREQLGKRYNQIYTLFKEFQARDHGLISQFQKESLKKLNDFELEFRRSWDRLDLMVKDISPNIEMIKTHITEDQFKHFMQDYHSQIQSICGRIDTFNACCVEVKPYSVRKDSMDRFNYEAFAQMVKEERNMLYFSFQKKASDRDEAKAEQEREYRVQVKSEESWRREQGQQPFRVLFASQQNKEEVPSPTFKKY